MLLSFFTYDSFDTLFYFLNNPPLTNLMLSFPTKYFTHPKHQPLITKLTMGLDDVLKTCISSIINIWQCSSRLNSEPDWEGMWDHFIDARARNLWFEPM